MLCSIHQYFSYVKTKGENQQLKQQDILACKYIFENYTNNDFHLWQLSIQVQSWLITQLKFATEALTDISSVFTMYFW